MATMRRARVELGARDDARARRGVDVARDATRAAWERETRAGEDDALPMGWKRRDDASTGRTYYYNKTLGVSSWTRPGSDAFAGGAVGGAGGADAAAAAGDAAEDAAGDAETEVDWGTFARDLATRMSETCEGVEMRAAATPRAVFLWERLSETRRALESGDGTDVERVGRELRLIEARLDDAEVEYAEWTREAAIEANDGDAANAVEVNDEDVTIDDDSLDAPAAPAREPEPRAGTIVRPPAPPLPPATVPVKPSAPKEETQLVKRRAVSSRDAKRRMVDVDKWAKARESEGEEGDNSKAAIEARNARQIEVWRAARVREGVSGSENPNFVPVGDWRANLEAARAKTRLEEFRERRETPHVSALEPKQAIDPPEKQSLPPDWRAFVDAESGNMYYGNIRTKETTWNRPSGL